MWVQDVLDNFMGGEKSVFTPRGYAGVQSHVTSVGSFPGLHPPTSSGGVDKGIPLYRLVACGLSLTAPQKPVTEGMSMSSSKV